MIMILANERSQSPEEVIDYLSDKFKDKSINFIREELSKTIKGKDKAVE